jgi:polyhydroxyalkanoate synthesis regulator phasin
MAGKWEKLFNGITTEAGLSVRNNVAQFFEAIKNEPNEIIKKNAIKVERYTVQLADGKITEQQYRIYLGDICELMEMDKVRLEVKTQARLQKIVNDVEVIFINNLLKILKPF